MKILTIVGARPQFIKLAPLSKQIRKQHREIIIHTGQHFDKKMSELFFEELNIPIPNVNLNINQGLHGEQTGKMLIELEKKLLDEKPELVIIFGDTNSTLAGALAASKLSIPVLHIEAGLRSFNKSMPEEINRITSDHVSDFLFAPTKIAMENLSKENLLKKTFLTGDIMVDSVKFALDKSKTFKTAERIGVEENNFYLLTLHRPYNVDDPLILSNILKVLSKLQNKVVFPVHPRTNLVIKKHGINVSNNIILTAPLGYLDFVNLQSNSMKIITDSGGIQKEAYVLKKPCITLRSETEWVETVDIGWNLLINPKLESNYEEKIELFNPKENYIDIFGKDVAQKMLAIINGM